MLNPCNFLNIPSDSFIYLLIISLQKKFLPHFLKFWSTISTITYIVHFKQAESYSIFLNESTYNIFAV